MYNSAGPNGHVGNTPRPRLESGLDLLDSWAETAGQFDRHAVYRALFAVADASVSTYQVFDDHRRPQEFSVLVREDLVLVVRMDGADSFGIRYVGPVRPTEAG
jgi:Family of unknown function (DUF6235)